MLPSSGKISMNDVNVELEKPENSRITLIDIDVRNLACVVNGNRLSLNDLKGKGKCKIHISITNMLEHYENLMIIFNMYKNNRHEEFFGKDVELDYELLVGDTLDFVDYAATGRRCMFKIDDGIPDQYESSSLEISKNHKIVCNFEDLPYA